MEHGQNIEMKKQKAGESIVIGLIDGLTVPFALAAGLTAVLKSSSVIFAACLSMTTAYSLFMGVSAYLSGRKYEISTNNFSSALIICLSYLAGGFFAAVPFLYYPEPLMALKISAIITVLALLISGYYESKFHNANVIMGSIRTAFIALVAATAAYGVASLFR
jgi:VIT1/CCC1 family predicted Fe2+/Mn2+ transporter